MGLDKIWEFKRHAECVCSVTSSWNEEQLASGDDNWGVLIWDVMSGDVLFKFDNQECPVPSLSFSPDGQMLVTGNKKVVIKILNLRGFTSNS